MQEIQCLDFMLEGEMKIWREFEAGGKLERFQIFRPHETMILVPASK